MPDATRELERLAEADGATFLRSMTGAWYARDKDGITVVFGALSRAEAARAYREDNDLVESTREAILEYVRAQYRPCDSMPEFQEGFEAYQKHGLHRLDRYSDGVKAQAWDCGANTAMFSGAPWTTWSVTAAGISAPAGWPACADGGADMAFLPDTRTQRMVDPSFCDRERGRR